jgi:hypothetical protein
MDDNDIHRLEFEARSRSNFADREAVQLNIESGQETVKGTEFQNWVSGKPAEAKLLAALGRGWRPGD